MRSAFIRRARARAHQNLFSIFGATVLGLFIPTSGALALDAAEKQASPSAVEEVEVIARRLDAARQAIQPGLGANQFQFDRNSLARTPQGLDISFDKLLLQAPGVSQDSGGDIHVRNEHGNVQYRLNGVLLPQSAAGFGNLLDTAIADKVVVLTGALPAQYGFQTAGVVDITTGAGSFESGGEIAAKGGSHDHREARGQIKGSSGGFNYFFTGRYLENNLGIDNPTSATEASHDQTRQLRGFSYLSQVLNSHFRVSSILGAYDGSFQIPNVPGIQPAFNYAGRSQFDSLKLNQRQRESNYVATVSLQGSWDQFDFQLSPFARFSQTRFTPDVAGDLILNGGADRTRLENNSYGVQVDSSFRASEKHTLRAGATISIARTTANFDSLVFGADSSGAQASTTPLNLKANFAKTGTTYGAYAQDEWSVTDSLTVNFGARFDGVDAYTKETQLSPRLNVTYSLSDSTSVHAGYARNFTPPDQDATARGLTLFANTVRAPDTLQNDPVRAEREHSFDVGMTHTPIPGLTLGLDGYYKVKRNLLDEGQFGESTVNSPFNYAKGDVYGIEGSTTFERGPFSAYANLAWGRERGRRIISGQIFFDADELDYISRNYIPTDHSQTWTGSGGASWKIENTYGTATASADLTYGSGLRKEPNDGSLRPNGAHLPSYTQVDVGLSQAFSGPSVLRGTTISFDVQNIADQIYLIRDGSGVGVGARRYGPRRGFYFTVSRKF